MKDDLESGKNGERFGRLECKCYLHLFLAAFTDRRHGQPSDDCSRVDDAHAAGWKRGAGRMDDSLFMTSVIVFPPQVQPFLPHPSLWEIGMQVLLAPFLGSIH